MPAEYKNLSEKAVEENKLLGCQYLATSLRSFSDGVRLFSAGDFGNIEDSVSLLYKGWERLWQASRLSMNNGHLINGQGRFYSLSDFLKDVKDTSDPVKTSGDNKLPSRNLCDSTCVPCYKCGYLCPKHALLVRCSCDICEDSVNDKCSECNSYKRHCEQCLICHYPYSDLSIGFKNHNPNLIENYGTNSKLLHGDFKLLQTKTPFRRNLELIKSLRNEDQHSYIEATQKTNLRLTFLLHPYITANILNYARIAKQVHIDIEKQCKNYHYGNPSCATSLGVFNVDQIFSAFTVPINLMDASFDHEDEALNKMLNLPVSFLNNKIAKAIKAAKANLDKANPEMYMLENKITMITKENAEVTTPLQNHFKIEKLISEIFSLSPKNSQYREAKQFIFSKLLDLSIKADVYVQNSQEDNLKRYYQIWAEEFSISMGETPF